MKVLLAVTRAGGEDFELLSPFHTGLYQWRQKKQGSHLIFLFFETSVILQMPISTYMLLDISYK